MTIASLTINDFRNLATVKLTPHLQGFNIIDGNNGCGKTSILEAIYYLSVGRSFRSSTASKLIRRTTEKFSIYSQLVSQEKPTISLAVERDLQGEQRLRIAENNVANSSELAALLPIRLINSQSHYLFESGPIYRRKFLDWGLFYHSEQFLSCWQQFERVLKQRNAALRDKRTKPEIATWTHELVQYGLLLDKQRREYVQQLTPFIVAQVQALLAISGLSIHYQPGWNEDRDYATVLANDYVEAIRLGYTPYGPQRGDLAVKINGISVQHFLSRGQQKLLICAMIFAQGMLLISHANKLPIYLIDDLPSELDLHSRDKLLSLLATQITQAFITAIDSKELCLFADKLAVPVKVFHVEHGQISAN